MPTVCISAVKGTTLTKNRNYVCRSVLLVPMGYLLMLPVWIVCCHVSPVLMISIVSLVFKDIFLILSPILVRYRVHIGIMGQCKLRNASYVWADAINVSQIHYA